MDIREEVIQNLYELAVNENLDPKLDECSKTVIALCEKYFSKKIEGEYMGAIFALERTAFVAGANLILDFIAGKGTRHERY